MENNLVSIIIPCYNQAEYLEKSVQSVIDQTYQNVEIIVINDGSTDHTEGIALNLQKKYSEKIRIISQKNSGVSEARNNAIKQSQGQYILPLDADDLIHKEMLSKCVETLKKHNADIVYTDTKNFGVQNYINKWKSFSETNPLYVTTSNATALYKKEVWEKIGGYKSNMDIRGGYEDWEFWINAYKYGFIFQHHSEVLFYYRIKEKSRYKQTLQEEPYHRAKIILNHPEMYICESVKEAISTVRETEKSADYYFYSDQKKLPDEKKLLSEVVDYMQKNTLQTEQIVNIFNKKILLCEVTLLDDPGYIKNVQNKMKIDAFLFYSSLRYSIPSLYSCKYAWYNNQELRLVEGSVFPFFVRFSDDKYEISAYKKLTKYLEVTMNQKDEELKKKQLIIEEKNAIIKERGKLYDVIKEKDEIIKERGKLYDILSIKDEELKKRQLIIQGKNKHSEQLSQFENLLHEICTTNLVFHPLKKVIAYRKLIKFYNTKKAEDTK